jgi:hypothetical protein
MRLLGVFIWEKVWIEHSLSESDGGGTPIQRCFSLTYYWPPLGVIALHSLFLYSDKPPFAPPSSWFGLFSSQTFSHINTPIIWSRLFFLLTLPTKTERTECSEMSAHKIQTPGNHPKERIQPSEHGKILESRIHILLSYKANIKNTI